MAGFFGQWFESWYGDWQGAQQQVEGAISGVASLSIAATGQLVNGAAAPATGGGRIRMQPFIAAPIRPRRPVEEDEALLLCLMD